MHDARNASNSGEVHVSSKETIVSSRVLGLLSESFSFGPSHRVHPMINDIPSARYRHAEQLSKDGTNNCMS